MTAIAVKAAIRCSAPLGRGDDLRPCGRPAWRAYTDNQGIDRGFCEIAQHAWLTTTVYPAIAGTQRRANVQ